MDRVLIPVYGSSIQETREMSSADNYTCVRSTVSRHLFDRPAPLEKLEGRCDSRVENVMDPWDLPLPQIHNQLVEVERSFLQGFDDRDGEDRGKVGRYPFQPVDG